jgi:hypothetical protein
MRTQSIAVAAVLGALSGSARADQVFNILNAPMYHERGNPDGAQWAAYMSNNGTTGFFSTYGPYQPINWYEGETIATTYVFFQPDDGSDMAVDWDIYDGASQIFLQPYRWNHYWHEFNPAAAFRVDDVKNIQVRTRHRGGGMIHQGDVHILREFQDKVTEFWPTQTQDHQLGKAVSAGDWVSGPGLPGCGSTCPAWLHSYGPLSGQVITQAGTYIALFHVETNSGSGDASTILFTLRVRYYNGNPVDLGTWDVSGADFRGNNVMRAFPIQFTVPSTLPSVKFELVRVNPNITITQSGTKIYKLR